MPSLAQLSFTNIFSCRIWQDGTWDDEFLLYALYIFTHWHFTHGQVMIPLVCSACALTWLLPEYQVLVKWLYLWCHLSVSILSTKVDIVFGATCTSLERVYTNLMWLVHMPVRLSRVWPSLCTGNYIKPEVTVGRVLRTGTDTPSKGYDRILL